MPDCWQRFIIDVPETQQLYSLMLDIQETAARAAFATKDPAWLVVSTKARAVQERFASRLDRIAVGIAATADEEIKKVLAREMHRDPTGNNPGLREGIHSEHLSTGVFSFGVVEVGLLDNLQAIRGAVSGEAYWQTQEFGSSHNVNRRIRGFFTGGGAADAVPNQIQGMDRTHPAFRADPTGGLGTIRRPIPAKNFMRDGTHEAETQWRTLVNDAVAVAAAELRAIQIPSP